MVGITLRSWLQCRAHRTRLIALCKTLEKLWNLSHFGTLSLLNRSKSLLSVQINCNARVSPKALDSHENMNRTNMPCEARTRLQYSESEMIEDQSVQAYLPSRIVVRLDKK